MTPPLTTLIAARMEELDLTPHTLALRLGYRNTNKGSRRVQALLGGRPHGQAELLSRLAAALDVSPEAIAQAVQAGDEAQERSRRDAFVPHAVLVTERTVPSQVTLCAVTHGERALRVSLDTAQPQADWARQVLREVNRRTEGGRREIPFFGPVQGFAVNYAWCRAVRFDLWGRALELLARAVQTGDTEWRVR